jgi:hypothetical protein
MPAHITDIEIFAILDGWIDELRRSRYAYTDRFKIASLFMLHVLRHIPKAKRGNAVLSLIMALSTQFNVETAVAIRLIEEQMAAGEDETHH